MFQKNDRFTVWIVPFRNRISIVLLNFRFCRYYTYVYTDHLYAPFIRTWQNIKRLCQIVRVSSVNLKTVFTCYSKQRILTVKATKPLAGTVVTWNCFAHFLRMGFRQTSFKTASLSLYWQLLCSLVLKSLARSNCYANCFADVFTLCV